MHLKNDSESSSFYVSIIIFLLNSSTGTYVKKNVREKNFKFMKTRFNRTFVKKRKKKKRLLQILNEKPENVVK